MKTALLLMVLAGLLPAATAAETSTGAISGFQYKYRHLRDPFLPLNTAAAGLTSSESGAKKTLKELEEEFDPAGLVIKALLANPAKGMQMAILNPASQGQADRYLVKGRGIQHIASGIVLKSYSASIQGDKVIIEKIGGERSVIKFPKKGEEKSP